MSKNRLYDFRVNWRQSYFYSNPNDNVILPIAAVASGLSTGLTDNHDWGTVRKFGSADFTLHATNNLRFNFDYYRTSDSGPTFTTESLDFFDSPSYWGTFARANPYYLYAPIDDNTNRFTGGIDYTFHAWTFHYNLGYQTFTENLSLNNVSSPELSIDPVSSSTKEPLTNLSQSEYRRLTTPISEFSFTGKAAFQVRMAGRLHLLPLPGARHFRPVLQRHRPQQLRRARALHGQPDGAGHGDGTGQHCVSDLHLQAQRLVGDHCGLSILPL